MSKWNPTNLRSYDELAADAGGPPQPFSIAFGPVWLTFAFE